MSQVKLASAPALGKGRMFSMLARHNLSQDEDYAKKKAKKGLQTMRHRHAIPALQLATLPPRYLDNWELWHRPRGLWVPSTSKGRARVKEGRFISGIDYTVPVQCKAERKGSAHLQNSTKDLDGLSEHGCQNSVGLLSSHGGAVFSVVICPVRILFQAVISLK